uniref:RNA helicase n=1 Tax=Rhabditophanes sp. KR3021 TaxID=114890 RepID=A0AC35TMP7_9BILA
MSSNKLKCVNKNVQPYNPLIRDSYKTIKLRRETHAPDAAFDNGDQKSLKIHRSQTISKRVVYGLKKESFADLKLHEILNGHLFMSDKQKLTTIQSYACSAIMARKFDVIISAPTGFGKTFSYLIPAIDYVLKERRQNLFMDEFIEGRKPLVIIFTLTRDLARQVYEELCAFAEGSKVKGVLCYGEIPARTILDQLVKGCDFVIGCMGKINDLVENYNVDFSEVDHVIIDEADRFADVENYEAMKKIMILGRIDIKSKEVTTILASATIIEKNLNILKNCFLSEDNVFYDFSRSLNHDAVVQKFIFCTKQTRIDWLISTIKTIHKKDSKGKILVFCESKNMLEAVMIRMLFCGIKAISTSGNRCQEKRDAAIRKMNEEEGTVLIATDVTERGVDFVQLKYVIHLNVPTDNAKYLNRIGRAGRHNNSEGFSYLLIDHVNEVRNVMCLVNDMLTNGYKVSPTLLSFYKFHREKLAKINTGRYVEVNEFPKATVAVNYNLDLSFLSTY